jgi:hypothetical protein
MNPDLLPDKIISDVCHNLGIDPGDDESYKIIEKMSRDQILESVCTWNGLIGWEEKIKGWIDSIYSIQQLKEALIEERAAVLTCDICDGGGEYGDLSCSGNAAMRGEPTRVTDYEGFEERMELARIQLNKEGFNDLL